MLIVAGSVWRASASTAATASPSETPGFRLNEIVTAGSWPGWVTASGPVFCVIVASDESGTRSPAADRT